MQHIVIAGAGHAGIQLADSLRAADFDDPITVIDAESGLPYQRPPLSKDFMAVAPAPEVLPLKASKFFTDKQISLIEANPVTAVHRESNSVELADGERIDYSDLVLATGARNRTLRVPGADLGGVHYLRNAADATRLRSELEAAHTAVVIGAGFIGLEFASAAIKRGIEVTVVECGARVMGRALSAEMSDYFADLHAAQGVRLVFGETVTAIAGDGHVSAVVGRHAEYPADLVVVGIGVEPNDELAAGCGLAVDDGIVVDATLQTSDARIWAIGDCARFPCHHTGASTRRESVQNAVDHARALALTLTGQRTDYQHLPWFWSIQGAYKLQIAGVATSDGHTVVSGDRAQGKFSVLRFDDGRLACVESVNNPAAHMAARKLLSLPQPVTVDQLAVAEFDLKRAAESHGAAPVRS